MNTANRTIPSGPPEDHLVRPDPAATQRLAVTPESAGWEYLSFSVIGLALGQQHTIELADQELAIVPLSGYGQVRAGGNVFDIGRDDVFSAIPHVVYAPPRTPVEISGTDGPFEVAIGSAPAEGKLPVRCFAPSETTSEVRGGGAARRQVNHILASPLPAERLILYEVYVPRGTWSGWPPHCHDGFGGSPYLEETYYFRLQPDHGFAIHRNWRTDEDFDEALVARDGDVALVTKGFHSSVACPGSNMYFLNFLAGDSVGDDRATPPCFSDIDTWIEEDWSAGAWDLPIVDPDGGPS